MRRSRYIRQAKQLPHRLMDRDFEILQFIDRFKYLSSNQIAQLLGVTPQAVNKRLKLLFHHHYLGKLPAQLSPNLFNSPDVLFINLDRKAACHLRKRGVSLHNQKRYNRKQPRREYLQHVMLTNDILISFELAVRDNPKIEFLPSHKLLEGSKRHNHSHPWKVSVFLPERSISRNAYPDAAFALHDQKTGKTQLYLVEADNMTMPLTRHDKQLFRTSNIKSKLIIYHRAWQQGVFRMQFKFPATRILFVTRSAERARHMDALSSELFDGQAPGLFQFTDIDHLQPGSIFWSQEFGL